MALQSQLFRQDPKLEAAAVSDPAHIMPGARGEHVRKIQLALIQVDSADIAADGTYGSATSAAVLAYTKKRNIVNHSYQAKADNIVGKMTITALDKELAVLDDERGCPDCKFGMTNGPPRQKLIASPALLASAGAPTPPAQPRDEALERRGGAIQWVNAALHYIRQIHGIALMQRLNHPDSLKMNLSGIENTEPIKALKVHFKFQDAPDSLQFLNDLSAVYRNILKVVTAADTFFANDMVKDDFAYAYLGALNRSDTDPKKKVFFCKPYLGKGPLFQTGVIVHEGAHFVHPRIDHIASELPKFDGTPVNGVLAPSTHNYVQMTNDEAFRNAYSYAQFALHAFKGTDYRITPFNE
jgi:peptidoglycan hydrolase-like protein with peptidoglycan-binding domain